MRNLKRLLLSSVAVVWVTGLCAADQMSGGDFVITKDLFGAAGPTDGPTITSANYTLGYAWGEPVSGDVISNATNSVISGYFGGLFGNGQTFQLLSSQVGSPGGQTFFQDNIPVGVPYSASVTLTFSDQIDNSTIPNGLQVLITADHLGHSSNAISTYTVTTSSSANTITITPQGPWLGNTLYDVQVSQSLLSVDGFALDTIHDIYFVTLLDHTQENVVLDPLLPSGAASSLAGPPLGPMSIDIPTESLSDYSAVLLSRDPLVSPLRVDPKIIQDANAKALAAGGPYRTPISIQEIVAYNAAGAPMGALSHPAEISLPYGAGFSPAIRPETLALWALDETHHLWVKIPASQNATALASISAPITQFSVFALMGSADGSTSDTFAFPLCLGARMAPTRGPAPDKAGRKPPALRSAICRRNAPSISTPFPASASGICSIATWAA